MVDTTGTVGDDQLTGTSAADTLDGGEGADSLFGLEGDDLLDGSAGQIGSYNEGAFADYLVGGTGSDTMRGGGGDDVYVYDMGDGSDVIVDEYYYHFQSPLGEIDPPDLFDGGTDRLILTNISPENVWLQFDGDDLIAGHSRRFRRDQHFRPG